MASPSPHDASQGRETAKNFTIHEEQQNEVSHNVTQPIQDRQKIKTPINNAREPLKTSKFENIQAKTKHQAQMDSKPEVQPGSMDTLLVKLSEQRALLDQQKVAVSKPSDPVSKTSAPESILKPNAVAAGKDSAELEAAELARLKKELSDAKDEIARQKQEIHQSRVMKQTVDRVINTPSETTMSPRPDAMAGNIEMQQGFQGNSRPGWLNMDDTRSEASNFEAAPSIWNNNRPTFNQGFHNDAMLNQGGRGWSQRGARNTTMPSMMMGPPGNFSEIGSPRGMGRGLNDFAPFSRGNFGAIGQPNVRRGNGFDMYGTHQMDNFNNAGANHPSAYQALNMHPTPHQPQPIGTPLSPMAAEFQAPNNSAATPWNAVAPPSPGQTYVSPMEPLNYRRLLDRSVTCNWKYIVDKIVCNNDQQASIFLQQKLKMGTAEQKYEIIEAIVAQAYLLMINRFGNFLVQRCFEHGTSDQVIAIANAIRGNTLQLSMDPFGCHVVQKAFDSVPEDYKAIMVHELLRQIPETVIHRYACHVWQKLFELRWSGAPPQIMKYVNEALQGMWHEVALGETGSLVVQNIFENCLEEDKRPCIDEVLQSIDVVAHGQFGNWCIQHICEHGLPADRSRAIDHVLRYATEYSVDQYASKVVEKCLKIGGPEFLERYLERVCEGRADRPRIPLIDIASDQYGNYLIQFILTHANPNHREAVASHIRKHMVSLRGSKFGSRVGMLCCNPAYTTHPGPGMHVALNNRFSSAPSVQRFPPNFR